MECDDHGVERAVPAAACTRGLKRKCGARGSVRLAFTAAVPCATSARKLQGPSLTPRATDVPVPASHHHEDSPFMNNMDAISYWIYTKRAPCLFNYENIVKKQVEQLQCSTSKVPSVKSKPDDEPSPRKKRKLKLLDDDSVSTEKQQNIYFKVPQHQKTADSSCKSNADDSDLDFNIKTSSAQKNKSKKNRLQRNCQTRGPRKNKNSTSRPNIVILRRSLRTAKHAVNKQNNSLNCSFQIFNTNVVNGTQVNAGETNQPDRVSTNHRSKSKVMLPEKGTNEVVPNGQFEDLSDVSGFTANYIRSTKMQSSKRQHKLRNQNNRNISKHKKQRQQSDKMIICVNKSVNTGLHDTAALNCSTDSSQNVIKLVTVTNSEQHTTVNKSTSLLKFMETKLDGSNTSKINKQESKNNLNISFQSRSSGASRYPRRHKNNTTETPEPNCSTNVNNSTANPSSRRYNMRKGTLNLNQKEISEENIVPRARSRRRKGLKEDVEESRCSVVQLNSSTEQVSSSQAVNVACTNTKHQKKNNTSRCLRSRTVRDKVGQMCKDSASEGSNTKPSNSMHCAFKPKCVRKVKKTLDKTRQSLKDLSRDKSGFAACFSDSDSDSEPLKQRKFFS